MKSVKLLYVVTYNGDVLCVCASRALARSYCRMLVINNNYHVDKFSINEQPLIKSLSFSNLSLSEFEKKFSIKFKDND